MFDVGRLAFNVRYLLRPLHPFAALLLLATGAAASITNWDPLPKPVGNANFRGYAQIERDLGSWRLPDGTEIPLHLVLQSDPSVEPGPFGPGWHFPFFRSTFLRVKDYEALWEMPNGRRMFFPRDRLSEESRKDEQRFRSREGDWAAVWEEKHSRVEATVTAADDPDTWFHYQDGRVESFRMGPETPEYRVDWLGGSRFPRMIRPANSRTPVVEIAYGGRTPEAIRVGEREWRVEVGEGDWTAPDGRSDYSAYRVSFLTGLTDPDGETERFAYEKGNLHERPMGVPGAAKATRMARLPVNRLVLSDGEGAERGFLAWEARSGFVVEDSGGAYTVASKGKDPEQPGFEESRRKGDIAPDAVRIERQPEEGPPKLWSYDYKSGVRERTDSSTGEIFRENFIVSPGPAYGKLRKRERKEPKGKWELVEHRAYDPEGRLLRIMGAEGVTTYAWEDRDGFSRSQEYQGGELIGERVYKDGNIVRLTEWIDGEENTFHYDHEGGSRTIRRYVEGEWHSTQHWGPDGRILYGKKRQGAESIFRYGPEGRRETVQLCPDGSNFLVRTIGTETVRITDPEVIARWLEGHAAVLFELRESLGLHGTTPTIE